VTGEGKKVTCSASNNPGLFDAVRGGLGQVGVITKATLALTAAPASVRRFLLVYPDLATMLRDERLLCGDNRFDAVQGAIARAPGGGIAFRLDAVKNFNGRSRKVRKMRSLRPGSCAMTRRSCATGTARTRPAELVTALRKARCPVSMPICNGAPWVWPSERWVPACWSNTARSRRSCAALRYSLIRLGSRG
jgi:hypothetical protein